MKFIRMNQLLERIPLSKSTLWTWAKDGRFPKPVRLGPRSTAWRIADIEKWEKAREKL